MKNTRAFSFSILLSAAGLLLSMTACHGSGGFTASSKNAEVTDKNITPDNPYVIAKSQVQMGFLSLQKADLKLDRLKSFYSLTGHFVLVDKDNKTISESDVSLAGATEKTAASVLYPDNANTSVDPARARVTCLEDDVDGFCRSVILDFYVKHEEQTYAAQLQVDMEGTAAPAPELKPEDQPSAGAVDEDNDADDASEADEAGGLYVGTLYDDPSALFDTIKPPAVPAPEPSVSPEPSASPSPAPSPSPSPEPSTVPTPTPRPSVSPSPSPSPAPVVTTPVPAPKPSPVPDVPSRPRDQAIGMAANGHLENGSSLQDALKADPALPIHLIYPERKRFYGTYELIQDLQKMAKYLSQDVPGNKLTIGDISQKTGGKLVNSSHKSHQNGLDADVSYPRTDSNTPTFIGLVKSDGSISPLMRMQEVYKLFEYAHVTLQAVDRIFVDAHIKKALCEMAKKEGLLDEHGKGRAMEVLRRLRIEPGHDNHFHLRIRCSTQQPRCRMMAEPPSGSGC
jgi:penicillin-insensitive murein endopeptidase